VKPPELAAGIKTDLIEETFQIGLYHLNISRQFDPAMKEFQMAQKLHPDNQQAKLNLVMSRFNKGVEIKDEALFEQALEDLRQLRTSADPRVASAAAQGVAQAEHIRSQVFTH
jgi:hypothetical protein